MMKEASSVIFWKNVSSSKYGTLYYSWRKKRLQSEKPHFYGSSLGPFISCRFVMGLLSISNSFLISNSFFFWYRIQSRYRIQFLHQIRFQYRIWLQHRIRFLDRIPFWYRIPLRYRVPFRYRIPFRCWIWSW